MKEREAPVSEQPKPLKYRKIKAVPAVMSHLHVYEFSDVLSFQEETTCLKEKSEGPSKSFFWNRVVGYELTTI